MGPNDLVTSSPELLAHMSAVRSRYTRTKWYNRAARHRPGKDHVFSELDEEKHMRRRQQMAAGVGRPTARRSERRMLCLSILYIGLVFRKGESRP